MLAASRIQKPPTCSSLHVRPVGGEHPATGLRPQHFALLAGEKPAPKILAPGFQLIVHHVDVADHRFGHRGRVEIVGLLNRNQVERHDSSVFPVARGATGARVRGRLELFVVPENLAHLGTAEDAPARPRKRLVHVCGFQNQEAADVLAGITKADLVLLDTGPGYGVSREIVVDGHRIEWLALTHPGNRSPAWARRHSEWARSVRG
jgi:hypothetical protein